MTTCIWSDNVLYVDSKVTNSYIHEIVKYRKISDSKLVFGTGDLYALNRTWDWLEHPTKYDVSNLHDKDYADFVSIIAERISSDIVSLAMYDKSIMLMKIPNRLTIIGSGSQYAHGAMAAGATPMEALEIACKFDLDSGGELHVIDFLK